MGLLDLFRPKKEDTEADRRERLLRSGRLADAIIFDIVTDDADTITHILYRYEIGGVDYESSQLLDDTQRRRPAQYSPGISVVIRYDPRQPGNSVVI